MTALFAAVLVIGPSHAFAESQPAQLELGLRTGYSIPLGRYLDREGETPTEGQSLKINSDAAGQIPIWFDLGARIGKIHLGGYFAYGIVVFSGEHADDCERLSDATQSRGGSATCTFHGLRLGANAHYHFGAPSASIDAWVGGGFGYEWLTQGFFLEAQGEEGNFAVTYHGFEFLNVQAGADLPLSDAAAFGPFIGATLASYRKATLSCSGSACDGDESTSQSIDDTALHTWVLLGVRGTYRF